MHIVLEASKSAGAKDLRVCALAAPVLTHSLIIPPLQSDFSQSGHIVRLPCAAATLCLSSQISMAASPPLNVIKLVENHLFKPHI